MSQAPAFEFRTPAANRTVRQAAQNPTGRQIIDPFSALRNLRRPKGGSVTLLPFPGVGFRFVTPSCIQGGRFKLPPLPWDGVALSYPTDTTICRTGAVFAICDNGAAADPLAGSSKFGRARNLKKPKSTVVPTWDNSRAPSAAPGGLCGGFYSSEAPFSSDGVSVASAARFAWYRGISASSSTRCMAFFCPTSFRR